jgi:hypothetical protein
MKRFTSLFLSVVIVLCLLVGSERRAWGYVDPGSGLLALQTAASALAASTYLMRRYIRNLFTRGKKQPDAPMVLDENS